MRARYKNALRALWHFYRNTAEGVPYKAETAERSAS